MNAQFSPRRRRKPGGCAAKIPTLRSAIGRGCVKAARWRNAKRFRDWAGELGDPNRLRVGELANSGDAEFPAEAGTLHTAER